MKKFSYITSITLALLIISSTCFATQNNNFIYKTFCLANKQVKQNWNILNQQITICNKKIIILSKSTFSSIKLTPKEKAITLKYFYQKNSNNCTKNQAQAYLMSAFTLMGLEKKYPNQAKNYYSKLTPKNTNHEYLSQQYPIIVGSFVDEELAKTRYLSIPSEKRKTINKIPFIHKQFNIIQSAKVLKLFH